MKKDLVAGFFFVLLAAVGFGAIFLLMGALPQDKQQRTMPPQTEPLAMVALPAPPVPARKPSDTPRRNPLKPAVSEPEKKSIPPEQPIEKRPLPEPEKVSKKDPDKKKILVAETPKIIPNKDPAAPLPMADVIVLGNIRKISRPDAEYAVEPLDGEKELILLGKVKTLKLNGATGKTMLDASALEVQEIVFDRPLDGDARMQVSAGQGTLTLRGEVTGSAQLDIHAPLGKVVFTSAHAPMISGGAKVTILAKEVDLNGELSGGCFVTVTLSKGGTLKFSQLRGGAHLHYGKANASDPEPKLNAGSTAPGTDLRKIPPKN